MVMGMGIQVRRRKYSNEARCFLRGSVELQSRFYRCRLDEHLSLLISTNLLVRVTNFLP